MSTEEMEKYIDANQEIVAGFTGELRIWYFDALLCRLYCTRLAKDEHEIIDAMAIRMMYLTLKLHEFGSYRCNNQLQIPGI